MPWQYRGDTLKENKMVDDIQYGDKTKYNSAISIGAFGTDVGDNCDLSENGQEYWCQGIMGVGVRVNKSTPQGRKLKKLINSGLSKNINDYVDILILKKIKPDALKEKIEYQIKESFREGIEHSQEEIRHVLGVRQ